jgi:hypothetical protein
VLASPATASLPRVGVLVPGERLGGISIGATAAQVRETWGARYGICRSCSGMTWYFNLRKFEPQGAGVELRRGRVTGVFTLWGPKGWRTSRGVTVGDNVVRVTTVYGPLARVECGTYYALTIPGKRALSAVYVVGDAVWGFGLFRNGIPVCR